MTNPLRRHCETSQRLGVAIYYFFGFLDTSLRINATLSMTSGFYVFVYLYCFGESMIRLAMTAIFAFRFVQRIAIEVIAVLLCVILAQNERNRTWASIERNFVAEITQMNTQEQIAKKDTRAF